MNLRKDESKRDFGAIVAAWRQLHDRTQIGVIQSKADYGNMVKLLDSLLARMGDDENHELASLVDLVGTLIERYEESTVRLPSSSPRETLRYLMHEHGLTQADLKAEIGSQGVVSEILNGKRQINVRQAKALALRFNVSSSAFL